MASVIASAFVDGRLRCDGHKRQSSHGRPLIEPFDPPNSLALNMHCFQIEYDYIYSRDIERFGRL